MTPHATRKHAELTRSLRLLLGVGLVLVVVGTVLHLGAAAAYDAGKRVGIPIDQRVSLARRAVKLVPWSRPYRKRRAYVETWKRADALLASGDYNGSMDALRSIVGTTLVEPDLLALYRRAQEAQAEGTNWKAHVLHGREGPGGTLRPEDLLP